MVTVPSFFSVFGQIFNKSLPSDEVVSVDGVDVVVSIAVAVVAGVVVVGGSGVGYVSPQPSTRGSHSQFGGSATGGHETSSINTHSHGFTTAKLRKLL